MRILVTGSAGHLGEALVRTLQSLGYEIVGLDLVDSPFTNEIGSIAARSHVQRWMKGVEAVIHTATLHKPHIVTHTRQDFVDTNITGTLNLLKEAASVGRRTTQPGAVRPIQTEVKLASNQKISACCHCCSRPGADGQFLRANATLIHP